nr:hypothetical protein [Ectothiorhodospira sp. PHS-1]
MPRSCASGEDAGTEAALFHGDAGGGLEQTDFVFQSGDGLIDGCAGAVEPSQLGDLGLGLLAGGDVAVDPAPAQVGAVLVHDALTLMLDVSQFSIGTADAELHGYMGAFAAFMDFLQVPLPAFDMLGDEQAFHQLRVILEGLGWKSADILTSRGDIDIPAFRVVPVIPVRRMVGGNAVAGFLFTQPGVGDAPCLIKFPVLQFQFALTDPQGFQQFGQIKMACLHEPA